MALPWRGGCYGVAQLDPTTQDMKTRKKSARDVVKLIDLVPVRTIKGGSSVVFGADSVGERQARMAAKTKTKDLTPKKNPKGGRLSQ